MSEVEVLPILPGSVDAAGRPATLGVLGGGQLGRLFVQAAQRLGYATAVLDPDPRSPAGQVSHHHVRTAYDDPAGLAQLAGLCQAITTEFENVPAAVLQTLAQTRPVAPGAAAVSLAQNRLAEKALFTAAAASGVSCAPYAALETPAQLQAIQAGRADLLPGILKTARLGYDGKGQVQVATAAALAGAWATLGGAACVLEKRLPLRAELSVLVARGADGQVVSYAPQRNVHVGGILAVTHAYAGCLPPALAARARAAAVALAQQLGYVGVLCVEFFVVDDGSEAGSLVVNEMAPRPHNSGHYTLDACDVSQFDLQVRALAGLPLAAPRQHSPAIMLNLLGEVWLGGPDGGRREPDWPAVLRLPGAHLHLYGKLEPRPGRKMGHLTITGPDLAQVQAGARRAAALLGLPGLDAI